MGAVVALVAISLLTGGQQVVQYCRSVYTSSREQWGGRKLACSLAHSAGCCRYCVLAAAALFNAQQQVLDLRARQRLLVYQLLQGANAAA